MRITNISAGEAPAAAAASRPTRAPQRRPDHASPLVPHRRFAVHGALAVIHEIQICARTIYLRELISFTQPFRKSSDSRPPPAGPGRRPHRHCAVRLRRAREGPAEPFKFESFYLPNYSIQTCTFPFQYHRISGKFPNPHARLHGHPCEASSRALAPSCRSGTTPAPHFSRDIVTLVTLVTTLVPRSVSAI